MKSTIRSFTQLSIVLLAVTIMSVSVLGNSAYSDHIGGSGGTIDVVAAEGSNTISISGTTDRSSEVIVKVLAPNRNIVSIDQITPTGEGIRLGYSTTINTNGPTWNQDGDYIITVQQSNGACKDPDSNWSGTSGNTNTKTSCGQQFMENKYNLIVRVEVTSGTTSATSISIDYLVEHDEYYVDDQHIPTAKSLKKLTLTADGIQGSTTINVSGTTDRSDEIIIKVLAPNGNIVAIDQITPSGGSFATTIAVGGPLWSQDGMYMITATQAAEGVKSSTETFSRAADVTGGGLVNYQNSAQVEVIDGHVIPEFGVIAAMILAVAIVSIIVVTAKTKLSLVPRY